ncbi:MAG: hypothetical protein DELT_01370 [Desulfovibrio sp.]
MNVQPYFDIELFLQTANETRLAGEEMALCLGLWEEWMAELSCNEVEDGGKKYIAVWLSPEIETAVATMWEESPSRGFLLNALAQTLCMCAVHELVPEVTDVGCAPVPPASESLAAAITEAGLPARLGSAPGTGLEFARKYAVVTRSPFGGGCEVCALVSSCPRAGSGSSFIELG